MRSIRRTSLLDVLGLILGCFLTTTILSHTEAYGSTRIAMTEITKKVAVDNYITLYLTQDSEDALEWESSDSNIAVIDSSTSRKAVVKGVGKGTAEIIAKDANGDYAKCEVSISVPNFSIDSKMKIEVEDTAQINVKEGFAKQWSSSNDDIVSIQSSGESYVSIKAGSVGSAVITAIDKYGSESKCTIEVRQELMTISLSAFNLYESYDYTEADFSYFYHSYHSEGWWDEDYDYHYSYDDYSCLDYYEINAIDGTINNCFSQNDKIVKVKKENNNYYIEPIGVGKTKVTIVNPYGEKEYVNCSVTLNYFIERECYTVFTYQEQDDRQYSSLETVKKYTYEHNKYGSGKLQGITFDNANVSATIRGKIYKGRANEEGRYSIKIPKYIKVNTPITIKVSQYGITKTHNRKVKSNNPKISWKYAKKGSKKVRVVVNNVHKGDYVKIKIGTKTYTKKVKKDSSKVIYKLKTKKQKRGQWVKITVHNRYKQLLNSKKKKIK